MTSASDHLTQATGARASYPSLRHKRVLVTGGGSGIGAGIVEGFVAQGADVTFFDIDQQAAEEVARRTGASFRRVNLMDTGSTRDAIETIVSNGGPIDILINNAANDDRHQVEDVTEAYWDDRLGVNLKHQFFCTQAVVAGMREKGGGVVINLGSISWHLGLPGLVLYETSKAAIEGLTRALARDLGRDNIRVCCVVPGNVRTPRQLQWYTPEAEAELVRAQCLSGRLVPEDVAAMILFLVSDDARLISGHEYFVDAGWR